MSTWPQVLLSLSCAVVLLSGCGGVESVRHPLHGTVRVDGVEIENGSISFLPTRGTLGTPATTLIVRGEYEFTTETGPFSGRHRVVVGADPKQSTALRNKQSSPGRNQQPAPDVQARSLQTSKLAPARPVEPELDDGLPQRRAAATKQPEAPPPPDPARNQWEMQYAVPAELTELKDFDFVTPVEEPET